MFHIFCTSPLTISIFVVASVASPQEAPETTIEEEEEMPQEELWQYAHNIISIIILRVSCMLLCTSYFELIMLST
jgi:hypothetical protein